MTAGVRPPIAIVVLLLLATVVAMAIGVTDAGASTSSATAAAAAAVACVVLIMTGYLTCRAGLDCSTEATTPHAGIVDTAPTRALIRSTMVTSLIYAWGAAALTAIYGGTSIEWRHDWQYASAMALIAIGHIAYLRFLASLPTAQSQSTETSRAIKLAALQCLAAATALVWLLLSGKLATMKGDWPANYVFVAGGIALVVVSALIVTTHRRLLRVR